MGLCLANPNMLNAYKLMPTGFLADVTFCYSNFFSLDAAEWKISPQIEKRFSTPPSRVIISTSNTSSFHSNSIFSFRILLFLVSTILPLASQHNAQITPLSSSLLRFAFFFHRSKLSVNRCSL
ncbi:hypothetical protein VNO78_10546 [Psophocarpus tetragonolobus]|uniref:Uncharacterized protein n=1 Tax=Psophocarpus tetragonolobus TaxID=3891 RepID=A0AAN9SRB3_PSOTE